MKASSVTPRVTFAINRAMFDLPLAMLCADECCLPCSARMGKDVLRGSPAGRLVAPAASVGGTKLQREIGAQFFAAESARWGV